MALTRSAKGDKAGVVTGRTARGGTGVLRRWQCAAELELRLQVDGRGRARLRLLKMPCIAYSLVVFLGVSQLNGEHEGNTSASGLGAELRLPVPLF